MKDIFGANPKIEELYSFEDGNCFEVNEDGLSNAIRHEKQTGLKFTIVKRQAESIKPKHK